MIIGAQRISTIINAEQILVLDDGKLVGKEINDLKIELGNPTEDYMNESGNKVFIYKTKKYGIPCERKFEINQNNIIESFTSSGCI